MFMYTRADRWAFVDEDDNIHTLDDYTFTMLSEESQIEVNIVERSFRAGADFPGQKRHKSRELTFSYNINKGIEQDFRDYENEMRYQLNKAIKLRDTVREVETLIELSSVTIEYDEGGFLHGATVTITLIMLQPYWEDIIETSVYEYSTTGTSKELDNSLGYIETPVIIVLTANAPCSSISFRNDETGIGIRIEDLAFGVLGNDEYTIDMKEGFVYLGDEERNNRIADGSGFFNLEPKLSNTITFDLNGNCDVEFKFKKRYYI